MKHIFAVLFACLAVVNCQQQTNRPPRPPPNFGGSNGLPVPMPGVTAKPSPPPRPKGCSPGCGATEICARLGKSYCRSSMCSVCIEMSSIRFPATALAAMFTQQTKPAAPVVQAPVQPVQPPSNALNTSAPEQQISIVEYAAKQRNISPLNEIGNATDIPAGKSNASIPPPPANLNSYEVIPEASGPQSSLTGMDINSIQDKQSTSSSVGQTAGIDLNSIDKQQVKYPIIVTVKDATNTPKTNSLHTHNTNSPADQSVDVHVAGESHLGHIDQTQMAKWYQQYQTFQAQQAKPIGAQSSTPAPDAFDYNTFQKFQKWLQQNNQKGNAPTQIVVEKTVAPLVTRPVTTPAPYVIPSVQTNVQPIVPVAPANVPSAAASVPQPTVLFNDFNSYQHQYNQWLMQQQNTPAAAITPQPHVAISPVAPPVLPVAPVPVQQHVPLPSALPTMQQQFLQWQQQQQLSQANAGATLPQVNTITNVQPQATSVAQTPNTAQTQTFDFSAFQQQMQQLQQQQQNQQQNQGPNVSVSNNQQTQQTPSQEIQINNQQNPQDNTFSYVPQQPANNFNNDPFFFNFDTPQQNTFYDPQPQNNGLMDMMLLGGLGGFGFGGGLFGF